MRAWPIDTSRTPGTARRKCGEVVAVQVVAGVDAQAGRLRRARRVGEALQHLVLRATCRSGGIALGVELDPVGADGLGSGHHVRVAGP